MLAKRIIPCLDVKGDKVVKGVNFKNLQEAGDPVELGRRYSKEGADELVYLDITATLKNQKAKNSLVRSIARHLDIPFTVGGGIENVGDVRRLLGAGADKISINSAAVKDPDLINQLSSEFGCQCVVVAIDVKQMNQSWQVFIHGGNTPTDLDAVAWAKEAVLRGAGEILLTSMDRDGTKTGFNQEITGLIADTVNCPVIASGGGGCEQDFYHIFTSTNADAALAANIFHFQKVNISDLKIYLDQNGIPIRLNEDPEQLNDPQGGKNVTNVR